MASTVVDCCGFFFFFNDTATTEIYTLSLHDALPISAEMQDDLRRIVLPRPPERLGQFMARIFRGQLEEEQKMLMDSDSMKLINSGPKKTPARAGPALTPPKPAPVAEAQQPEGATQMLPQAPRKAPSVGKPPPPRIAPRPPPAAPPPKAKPAGDTLVDGGMQPYGDESPGATAMLMTGQAPPPPRGMNDTVPERMEPEEGDARTAILGNTPSRATGKKPVPMKAGSTDIISPEDSEAARQAALAKMAAAPKGVLRTHVRPDQNAPKKSQKSTWIMLGVGGLIAVAGIIALLFFLLSDDTSPGTPRRKRTAPVEQTQAAPADTPQTPPATDDSAPNTKASYDAAARPENPP